MIYRLIGELVVLIVMGVGVYYLGMWLAGKADENARIRGEQEEKKTTVVMKGKKTK
jgi:hypothetical protein